MDISSVGKFLQAARKNKHVTQGYVAEQLGVSAQAVSKWERGENLPDIAFFPDIARIYDIELNEILAAGQLSVKRNSFEEDLKKIQYRLDDVIKGLSELDEYESLLDDILPYSNSSQRSEIMMIVLEKRDYEILETLIPYMNNIMKTKMLTWLLDDIAYDVLEDIMPIFMRKQRGLIAAHFKKYQVKLEIVENFIPFFDKSQREELLGGLYYD